MSKRIEKLDKGNISNTIIDYLPIAIYHSTHKGANSSTIMSNKWEEWSGYSTDILLENPDIWMKTVHPDDINKMIKCYYQASKEGGNYDLEYRLIHRDEVKTTFVRDHGRFVEILDDGSRSYNGFIEDITQEVLAEQKSQDLEERYRLILENQNDLIYILNSKLDFEYVNEKVFKKILGYERKDLRNHKPLDMIHPEDHNKVIKAIRKGIESGEGNIDLRVKKKNGEYRIHNLTGKFFIDSDGQQKALIISKDINDQKVAEELLRESEEKYRLITENANDTIRVLNEQFEFEYINEIVHKRILGYTKDDMIGKMTAEFFHPDDLKNAAKSSYKILKQGKGSYEARFKCKNGEYKWFEFAGKIFYDGKNDWKIMSIARDITERKLTDLKIKESEEKYRLISENANDMIRVLNDKFEFEYINEEVHKNIVGYTMDDMIGKRSLDFYHPNDVKHAVRSTYKSLKQGKGSYEARFICKNGDYKWFEFVGKIFYNDKNEKKIISIIRDITERRNIFEQIQKNEELLRSFIRESYDGFSLTDEYGKIIEWNKGQEEIFELKKEYVINKPFWKILFEVIPENMRVEGYFTQMKKTIKDAIRIGNAPWLNRLRELYIEPSQGKKKIIQQLPFLIKTNSGNMLGSVIRDITKQKESELTLSDSEKKYREAFDTANFYSDLFAHDINNILQVINSSAELILMKNSNSEGNEEIKDISEIIHAQVQRGKKLVSSVRMLSELDKHKISLYPIKLFPELKKAIEFIKKSYLEKDLSIHHELADKNYACQANNLLQELFENILTNAVKYNNSSTIEIDIRISKYKLKSKEFIKIEIIDNGIGVPDSRKKLIFEKGIRDRNSSKGMGLGLSLVKKILDAYGGKIWVEDNIINDYSKGSNFIILLPKV